MGDNATLIIFLGFAIYLMSLFPTTYCSVPVKIQSMTRTGDNEQEEESSLRGWEEMEESFVASSTGEGMELIDMVEPEGSEILSNSAVKNLLLDLALLKIVLFLLMHDIEIEIISVIMNDNNLNIYLCFMITCWTVQTIEVVFTNPEN